MENGIEQLTDIVEADAMRGLAQAFADSLDVRPRTKAAYLKNIGYFLEWAGAEGITRPRRADVLAYKEMLVSSFAPTTAAAYLGTVRCFFSWVNAETGYPDIAKGIKNPKSARAGHLKDALGAAQARDVLDGIGRDSLQGKRDYAICALMLSTGLRTIEIERADAGDVRWLDGARVLFVWGKGRDCKDEYVVLAKPVQDALADYMDARREAHGEPREDSPLFVSTSHRNAGGRISARTVSRIAKESMRAAGYDDSRLTAHSFRHTAVTVALMQGAGIRDVQKMARHGSPVTTERYAHDLRRLDNAAEHAVAGALFG